MMNRNWILLLARIAMSAVFLYSGLDKLMHWPGAVAEAQALGLPVPALAMASTIAVQLAGGLSVLLGVASRPGVALLAVFTIAATLLAHWPLGLDGPAFQRQLTVCLEHLAIVGGFVALIAAGPGAFSIDAARKRRSTERVA